MGGAILFCWTQTQQHVRAAQLQDAKGLFHPSETPVPPFPTTLSIIEVLPHTTAGSAGGFTWGAHMCASVWRRMRKKAASLLKIIIKSILLRVH